MANKKISYQQKLRKRADKRKKWENSRPDYMKNYMARKRKQETPSTSELSVTSKKKRIAKQNATNSWDKQKKAFERNIRLGFTTPCECCGRLWPPNSLKTITKDELTFDGFSEEFIDHVFALHQEQNGVFCQTCAAGIKSCKVPRFCLSNGLVLPDVDVAISDLNRAEERLVAPCHVFQTIWPVMGPKGQFKTKGAIVNVPVNMDTTVNSLPRSAADSNLIHIRIARRMQYKSDYMSGFVRNKKVYEAAKVLVTKPLFEELGISLSVPDEFQVDMSMQFSDDDIESIDYDGTDSHFNEEPPVHNQETMISTDEGFRIAPAEGYRPTSILVDKNVDFLAFPKLYGGFKMDPIHNSRPLPYSDFAKSVTMQYDRRVAQRGDYLLFMAKKLELMKLSSNINICLRKKIRRRGYTVTAQDMLDSSFVSGILQHDDGYKILRGVRSSASHWQQEKTKVLAMIRQFGLPSLFITVSAADTRWPELLVQLKKNVDNEIITEEDAAKLSYEEKARLIQSDPVTCSLHFDRRFKCLKKTWNSKHGPFRDHQIIHHYHRIEFQQRGSPHVHMLLWLQGAPKFDPNYASTWHDVCAFIDSIISISSDDIADSLYQLQLHKHTKTCRKRKNPNECRFGIPHLPMDKTRILSPLEEAHPEDDLIKCEKLMDKIKTILQDEATSQLTFQQFLQKCGTTLETYILSVRSTLRAHRIFLKRSPQQTYVNPFNPKILQLMRSNMDIQFILDPYGVACYVVDYINKTDRGMSDTMQRAWKEIREGNFSLKAGFKKIVNTFYNNSELSIQEACYNILQLHLSECSETSIFIPTSPPSERVRMVRGQEQLLAIDPNSTDIFVKNLLDHYTNRPNQLLHLSLAEFSAFYDFTYKSGPSNIPMNDGKGFVHQRTTPKIIRYRNYCYEIDPENYFREHVMLYLPWVDEETDILKESVDELFHNNIAAIQRVKKQFHLIEDGVLQQAYEDASGEADLREGEQEVDTEKPTFDFDEFHFDDAERHLVDVEEQENGANNQTFFFKSPGLIPDSKLEEDFTKLNDDQRDFVNMIGGHFKCNPNVNRPPVYQLITGGAGVGKSLLISVLYQTLLRIFNRDIHADPDKPPILLCAPTGKAAFNIKGQTIHNLFKLPINQKTLNVLSENVSNSLAMRYARVELIIIDEISMVGQTTFNMIDQRLRHLFDKTKSFGGKSVIVVGDFFQLKPVFAKSLYHPNLTDPYQDIFGDNIWHLFKVFKLSQIMRQSNLAFQTALNHLAVGELTAEDQELFKSRTFKEVPPGLNDAVHLFARNEDVDAWNDKAVSAIPGEAYNCEASDVLGGTGTPAAKRQMLYSLERSTTTQCMGIPKMVKLKENAKYMLTYNIDTNDGLCNGATCTLKKINYGRNKHNEKKPLRIWVQFDEPSVGQLTRNRSTSLSSKLNYPNTWTPLEPIVVKIRTRKNSSLHVNRMQFPLTLAHAITIHKSQGQTLKLVVVHITKRISRDLLYVACSRATSLEGLYIIGDFKPPPPMQQNDYLLQEIKRWDSNLVVPMYKFLRQPFQGVQVVFHNVQSLPKHWRLLINDKTYQKSHVLMFGETWTKELDNFSLPNFNLVQRIDSSTSRKPEGVHIYSHKILKNMISTSGNHTFSNEGRKVQVAWILLKDILIASVYAAPHSCLAMFSRVFRYLMSLPHNRIVIMGDMNINSQDPAQSHGVLSFAHHFGLKLQNKYTITTLQHTNIDWVLSNFDVRSGTYVSFFSYHDPIWIRIPTRKINCKITMPRKQAVRSSTRKKQTPKKGNQTINIEPQSMINSANNEELNFKPRTDENKNLEITSNHSNDSDVQSVPSPKGSPQFDYNQQLSSDEYAETIHSSPERPSTPQYKYRSRDIPQSQRPSFHTSPQRHEVYDPSSDHPHASYYHVHSEATQKSHSKYDCDDRHLQNLQHQKPVNRSKTPFNQSHHHQKVAVQSSDDDEYTPSIHKRIKVEGETKPHYHQNDFKPKYYSPSKSRDGDHRYVSPAKLHKEIYVSPSKSRDEQTYASSSKYREQQRFDSPSASYDEQKYVPISKFNEDSYHQNKQHFKMGHKFHEPKQSDTGYFKTGKSPSNVQKHTVKEMYSKQPINYKAEQQQSLSPRNPQYIDTDQKYPKSYAVPNMFEDNHSYHLKDNNSDEESEELEMYLKLKAKYENYPNTKMSITSSLQHSTSGKKTSSTLEQFQSSATSSNSKFCNVKSFSTSTSSSKSIIERLNETKSSLTSRHLQLKKAYKVVGLEVTDEEGFNNTRFKRAVATLKDPTRKEGTIKITMPKPVAKMEPEILEQLQNEINNGNYPSYIVNGIVEKQWSHGKGTYDMVDYSFQ